MAVATTTANTIDAVASMQDLAEHFGVSTHTIRRWVRRGEFPEPERIGRRLVRWKISTVNQWIQAGCPRVGGKEHA